MAKFSVQIRRTDMAPNPKINLKDKVDDGEMDLSMLDIQEVPVKDIAVYRKVFALDLSNNHLSLLPQNFSTLVNLSKLDLSKNQIRELPDNFGDLVKLKYLDLYKNQLQHLPLTFSKLKLLKWLDLKDNPLVPAIKEAAGQCVDTKQCQLCAKSIVTFYTQLNTKVEEERDIRQKQRQKDKAASDLIALKQKQREKKIKKKEQPKQKSFVETIHRAEVIFDDSDVDLIKYSDKQNIKKPCFTASLFKYLFLLGLLSMLCMFISTAGRYGYTDQILNKVEQTWNVGLSKVPQTVEPFLAKFGGVVKNLHNITGHYIYEIQKTEHYKLIVSKFQEYYNAIL